MKVLSDILLLLKLISFLCFFLFFSLEAENHRLSQQLATAHSGAQNSYNFRPHEEIELLRAQVHDKNVFVVLRIKTEKCQKVGGRHGGPTVSALDSGASGPGSSPGRTPDGLSEGQFIRRKTDNLEFVSECKIGF